MECGKRLTKSVVGGECVVDSGCLRQLGWVAVFNIETNEKDHA